MHIIRELHFIALVHNNYKHQEWDHQMRRLLTTLSILAVLLLPANTIAQQSGPNAEFGGTEGKWHQQNDQILEFYNAGQYTKATLLAIDNWELASTTFGHEHPNTLSSIQNLAGLYQSQGLYGDAERLFLRALAVSERVLGEEHPETIFAVNNLAVVYKSQGRYDEAAPLQLQALVISERVFGEEHPETITAVNNLAILYQSLGNYGEAKPLLLRALAVREQVLGKEHPRTLVSVHNLARLYQHQGRYDQAEPLYSRALAARERVLGEEHPDTLISIGSLAGMHQSQGRYGDAEPLYLRTLAASERVLGQEHPITLTTINNLAGLYYSQGRYSDAEPLYLRTLAASERVRGQEHPHTLTTVNNLALLYKFQGRYGDAEALYLRALSARERMLGKDHPNTIISVNNLAGLYESNGRYDEAETLFLRALAASERELGEDHPNTLTLVSNLGSLYWLQGRYDEAEPFFRRALFTSERVLEENHINRAGYFANYADSVAREVTSRPAAILFQKHAVNILQGARANMSELENDTQAAFLSKYSIYYETLQEWLIEAGRFTEAEQVGRMLKEQEYFDFIRRRSGEDGDPRVSRSELTSLETEWEAQLESWSERPNRIATELAVLKTKRRGGTQLTSLEQFQLNDLQKRYDTAYAEYKTSIDDWLASVRELSDEVIQEEARDLKAEWQDDLQLEIEEIGANVAALQLVAFEDGAHAFLITPGAFKHIELTVTRTELFQAIYAARKAVQPDPGTGELDPDAKVPLQALYEILMAPIERELEDAGTETLMLNLQGAIRYVPFAALHDGEAYLTERYKLAMFTHAARTSYKPADTLKEATGFGVAEEHAPFKALPSVTRELASILGTKDEPGILTGPSYLDTAFTMDALKSELERARPILHIASHFAMRPGNDSNSFLLLGDGTPLTLAQINETAALRFRGVELLTLSACSTALSTEGTFDVDSGTGVEVEGFGVLAQRKGAKAVIASLWDVNDSSTADLMTELYTNLATGDLNKAEALQAAQMSLIKSADKNHPYYWAPFILMGNWK